MTAPNESVADVLTEMRAFPEAAGIRALQTWADRIERALRGAVPVATVVRTPSGQIAIFQPDGSPFDMSKYVGCSFYTAPPAPAASVPDDIERHIAEHPAGCGACGDGCGGGTCRLREESPPAAADAQGVFSAGDRVVWTSLLFDTKFVGTIAEVIPPPVSAPRFRVRLDDGSEVQDATADRIELLAKPVDSVNTSAATCTENAEKLTEAQGVEALAETCDSVTRRGSDPESPTWTFTRFGLHEFARRLTASAAGEQSLTVDDHFRGVTKLIEGETDAQQPAERESVKLPPRVRIFEADKAPAVCTIDDAIAYAAAETKRADALQARVAQLEEKAKAVFNLYGYHWDLVDGGLFVDQANIPKFEEVFCNLGVCLGLIVEDEESADVGKTGDDDA